MTDPYVGEIRAVGFRFAPAGWAMCDGQLMPISQNTDLYAVLGTMYGGDGETTFALPDLRGRFPLAAGQGQGLSAYNVGDRGGEESVTLNRAEIPAHTHIPQAATSDGAAASPEGANWAVPSYGRAVEWTYATTGTTASMQATALGSAGGNLPHNNLPPYQVVNFIIALAGEPAPDTTN